MDSLQALRKAIEILGGVVSAARAIGLKNYQTIQQWKECPAEHCPAIERATFGQVTCEELRPDLAEQWSYLRGTGQKAA